MEADRRTAREPQERDRALSLCSSPVRPLVGSKLNDDIGPLTYIAAGTAPTEKLPLLVFPWWLILLIAVVVVFVRALDGTMILPYLITYTIDGMVIVCYFRLRTYPNGPNRKSAPAAVTTYAGPAARAPPVFEEDLYYPKHNSFAPR